MMCQLCFGPLRRSEIDPDGAHLGALVALTSLFTVFQ